LESEAKYMVDDFHRRKNDPVLRLLIDGFSGDPFRRMRKHEKVDVSRLRAGALLAVQPFVLEEAMSKRVLTENGFWSRVLFGHAAKGGQYDRIGEDEAKGIVENYKRFLTKLMTLLIPTADRKPVVLPATKEVADFIEALFEEAKLREKQNPNYLWPRRHELVHRLAATFALMDATELAMEKGIPLYDVTPVILEKHLHAGLALVEASELYAAQYIPAAITRPVPVPKVNAKWAKALEILRDNGGSMAKAELAKRVPFSPPNMKDFLAGSDKVEKYLDRRRAGKGRRTIMIRLKPSAEGVGQQTPSGESGPSSQPAEEGVGDLNLDDLTLNDPTEPETTMTTAKESPPASSSTDGGQVSGQEGSSSETQPDKAA
jgi:hypothetical protein